MSYPSQPFSFTAEPDSQIVAPGTPLKIVEWAPNDAIGLKYAREVY